MPRLSIFLVFPLLPGCLAYGYPSVTYTSGVSNLPAEVRAFKSTTALGGMSIFMTGGESVSSGVEEIPLKQGCLDSQKETYFAYSVGGFPVKFFQSRSWHVMLFRPGYEVITIPSTWSGHHLLEPRIEALAWKPAPDLDSQVNAIETLCLADCMHPNAKVLQFAAQEYERLAASPLDSTSAQREALLAKARLLRERITKQP